MLLCAFSRRAWRPALAWKAHLVGADGVGGNNGVISTAMPGR